MKDSGQKQDMQEQKEVQDQIRESGQVIVENGKGKPRIYILSVIGEIEGHENLSGSSKTTKYEHVLPKLAEIEGDDDVDGILLLINTVGGDVSCGARRWRRWWRPQANPPSPGPSATAIPSACRWRWRRISPLSCPREP